MISGTQHPEETCMHQKITNLLTSLTNCWRLGKCKNCWQYSRL